MDSKKISYLFPAVLIIVIIAGIYFRLIGLARWPVAVDEYYIIKSVQNILKNGLPEYSSGGYYERGIIYQYFVALLMLLGLKAELASRIIPVLTNILTLIPVYLISKKISNKFVALSIIFVFSFSVWEIEFARFARMYSPFQMIFMYYLYFLFKWFTENDENIYKWLIILSTVSIFTYEASIFLAILNFLPIFWNKEKSTFDLNIRILVNRKLILVSSLIVFVFTYFYLNFDFRGLGQHNLYPFDYANNGAGSSKFRLPFILLTSTFSDVKWFIFSLVLLMGISFISYLVIRQQTLSRYTKISIICLLIMSFSNLYGLMLYVSIMFLLINWIRPEDIKKSIRYTLPVIILTLIFWSVYILSGSWHDYYGLSNYKGINALKFFFKEFINYPYFYESFVLFRNTLPWFTVINFLLLASGLFMLLKRYYNNFSLRFLYFILMFVILIITFINLTYFDTRYFLFLYPLNIILTITALVNVIDNIFLKKSIRYSAFVCSVIIGMIVSEDFNLDHLFNIDSRNVNFRTGFTKAEKIHYYPRWDTRSPAEYINTNAKSTDLIISNEQVNDLYLRRLNYIYRDFRNADFPGESVKGGKKERWTNANLIYNERQLLGIIKKDSLTKWVLINTMWGIRHLNSSNFFQDYKKYAVYANYDSSAIVYKISSAIFSNQLSANYK